MMVALTRDAQGQLDRYMRRVKVSLRGQSGVDAGDVERDVLGHIEAELEALDQPVTAASLGTVLDRLGSPTQWVSPDDLPLWRRVVSRLRWGPEDWRLAYLTFACFFGGPVLASLGEGWSALGGVMLPASILMARATLALLAEHDEDVGARRWLIYPPLVLFYAAIALPLLAWPIFPLVASLEAHEARALWREWVPQSLWILFPSVVALCLGVWWIILGGLLTRFTQAVSVVFWPFGDAWDRRYSMRLVFAGLALAVIGTASIVITSL